jgi:hypothetical protein
MTVDYASNSRMHPLYWALLCLSPAFILSYSVYSLGMDYGLGLLALALALLHIRSSVPSKSRWFLVLAMALFAIAVYRFPFAAFTLPFFVYGCLAPGNRKSTAPTNDVLLSRLACIIFIALTVWRIFFGLDWSQFQFALFQKTGFFYLGFFCLSLLALLPLFFIRLRQLDWVFYGFGLISIFSLIGFGADWGYCLAIFCTLVFTSLIFNQHSVVFRPHVARISGLTVILYALLWNIPTPFVGTPGLGLYGVLYETYPRLKMEDPLKHPFWREAAERYPRVELGQLRNGLPPDSQKLEFLLKRAGIQQISFQKDLNATLQVKGSDFNTFYVLDDWRYSPSMRLTPNPSVDLLARIDGYLVYAPGWKICKQCREIAPDLQIAALPSELKVGEVIAFGTASPGVQLLSDGWALLETWGVWSNAKLASVYFPRPQQTAQIIELNLRAFIAPTHLSQEITIALDGKVVGTYRLAQGEGNIVNIPLPSSSNNFYKMDFQIHNPIRPVDLGFNQDQRLLGIALVSAKFK